MELTGASNTKSSKRHRRAMENQKILFVSCDTYKTDRNDETLDMIEQTLTESLLDKGYDVEFESVCAFRDDYDFDINVAQMMKDTDDESAEICMDDYLCVITEGFSSWLWMNAKYSVPLVCINPVLNPNMEFQDYMSDEAMYAISQVQNQRQLNTEQSVCIITSEFDGEYDVIDEQFKNKTMIKSEYTTEDIELWKEDVMKAVQFVEDNWSE